MIKSPREVRMHVRNRFRRGYDFRELIASSPRLARFIRPNPHGSKSINFADPDAVKALNQALLKHAYGLEVWDVPSGYLCPPIPGRSDYLHHLADLLADGHREIPRGRAVAVLDIGVGANCIYPLIGASEYGWRFVGSEIDPVALAWARKLAAANNAVAGLIECRLQGERADCFKGVVKSGESFDLSMCNPPFHASAAEAADVALKKQRNLRSTKSGSRVLNFGGKATELWCPGGELGFVQRLIRQSIEAKTLCRWFTTLVSRSAHLPSLHKALKDSGVAEVKAIEMAQGQKESRILAWTFMDGIPAALKASRKPARSQG